MTRFLYLSIRVLSSPLEALFTLLIFILSKEGGASPVQIALLACSKPIVSLLAFHASSLIVGRPDRIRKYLVAALCVGAIPCLFFPFLDHSWFYVASYPLFIGAQRAMFPAWAEILKEKVGLSQMPSLIAKGTSIHYFLTIGFPFLCSFWLDHDPGIWKVLFFAMALLQLFSLGLLFLLKLDFPRREAPFAATTPWKNGVKLLSKEPDFARYLLLFFLGGAGIIAIQPITPIFFTETLLLSYRELTVAISLCKGFAFVITSEIWARCSQRMSLYLLNGLMNCFSCLFILLLILSSKHIGCLFLAYLMYGAMQGGCEISWNLSGPLFSKEKESTAYSNLNLAVVGIRGCLCPVIAHVAFVYSTALTVFIGAGILCLISLVYALWLDQKQRRKACLLLEH